MTHHSHHPRTTVRAVTSGVTVALLLSIGLAGCSSSTQASTSTGEGQAALNIVASTTQLADFAREVGGSDVTVTGLLPTGGSAHHFDPSPKDLLSLSNADVLIVNGAGLETFVDAAVEASGFSGTVITAADGIDLDALADEAHEHESSAHDHDHDHDTELHDHDHDHDHEAESEAGSHDGHDHGPVNPHLWTAPRLAAQMVAEVAHGLEAADPEHAERYAQRAADYRQRLSELDGWVADQFAKVPESERVLVSSHNSLSYYLDDYGITFAGAIMPGFEDNAEPSAKDIDALVSEIKRLGVQAIFVESSMSPKLAVTIAREADVRVVGDDPNGAESLFADGLGAPGSGAETYIDATVHNTRLIVEAWGYQVDSAPEGLGAA